MTGPPPGRDRCTGIKDAIDAVRAKSAGKSRDEIEQLLRDELVDRASSFLNPSSERGARVADFRAIHHGP
jgi:hypothetical protein